MIDEHFHPENWGVKPKLIQTGLISIDSYSIFIVLALIVGIAVYYYNAIKSNSINDNSFYMAISALVGGVLGAKIPIWIINFPLIISQPSLSTIFSGRTIIGGLLGGMLSVIWIKRKLRIKTKRGNLFAPSVALGITVGRIGCFLRGCCYGVPTTLPWGVNFGDGIMRHPTQFYEAIFTFVLFVYFQFFYKKPAVPGEMFGKLMVYYFVFRFFEEFIRANQIYYLHFSYFQWLSIGVLLFLYRDKIINIFKTKFKFYGKQNY
jgi:phosphatidylglycerol:prolipoprotein diacylglycerol transferase